MKNQYVKYRGTLIVFFLFLGFSCQDLKEEAKGELIGDSFFQSESDLEAGVIATYAKLLDGAWDGLPSRNIWAPLFGGDDIAPTPASAFWVQFDRFSVEPLNGILLTLWGQFYNIIYSANNVIENYESVEGDQQRILRSVAEVKFLRAFAYFWLVRLWGDVPITSLDLNEEITRSSTEEIYSLIVEDLQFAESQLPEFWPEEPGRPTVFAAKSLMAQVYLTMAGWPLKDDSKYVLAAQKAKEVIDNSPHRLLENYGDLWLMENEHNDETVWGIQFCPLVVCGVQGRTSITATSMGPSEEGGWDQIYFEIDFFNRFPEGPRKEATFHTEFTNGVNWENSTAGHPFVAKYRDGSVPGTSNFEHKFLTGRNIQYLRFAEVLLIYAEATAMASGPDESAYEAINQVKRRAAGLAIDSPSTDVDLQIGLSAEDFRNEVLEEKSYEFAAEFIRWFDLVRTEKVEEANANKHPDDLTPLGSITKENYIFPIPEREIQLNPNLTQNSGY